MPARLSTEIFGIFAGVTLLSSGRTSPSVDEPVGYLGNVSYATLVVEPGSPAL